MILRPPARIAALLVALVGLWGLALHVMVSLEKTGSVPATLWALLRFFTIIGNALTALVLLGIALGIPRAGRPGMLGGITLIMALIGVVYAVMLRQTEHLSGAAQMANILSHYSVPPLVALYWLVFAPKGRLTRIDPLLWTILPLAYFPYALARAQIDGRYPYPFIDAAKLGWPQVLYNATVIALGFLIAGLALVWLDRRLAGFR